MSEQLIWIEPNGTQHVLDDPNGFYWTPGAAGMFMPPMQFQGQQIPLQPGEIPRLILAGPRDVLVPLLIKGISRSDFFNNLELMTRMFYTTNPTSPGVLRRVTANGHTRDLQCFYADGATGDESVDHAGVVHMYLVVTLHASYPFWLDSVPTTQIFTPSGEQNFFQNPFFPLHLSASGQSSAFTIINTGDENAYPTWIIVGPATNPVLTNTYTAPNGIVLTKKLSLGITLASTDVLTIKTFPGQAAITKQDGSNQFGAVSDFTSSLWPLVPGVNQCGIAMSGTSAGSQVTLSYKQAYLAP